MKSGMAIDYILSSEETVKYYGLKKKIYQEDFLYAYAKGRTKILSILPGKRRDFWKRCFDTSFSKFHDINPSDNSLPAGSFFELKRIITSDLIRREDIKKLQKGIRHLLKERTSNHLFRFSTDGVEEICSRLEKMDTSLLLWYQEVNCGAFDFQGLPFSSTIDYFTVTIKNVNSSFLGLEFSLSISKQKLQELNDIINSNFHDSRGYAQPSLTVKSEKSGAFKNYNVVHYNPQHLKADSIYEFITYIEWEFYEALKTYFPFVLHSQGVMPPRIELYYTDIDYQKSCKPFWESIGISSYQGQFIDERQKMFFESSLSGRYMRDQTDNRLIYIVKDDGIEAGQFKSVKDFVYEHLREYTTEYFRFLFLGIMSKEAGKHIVLYKHKLDRIKLRRNHLKALLKLKYNFSKSIDTFMRYIRDDSWEQGIAALENIYTDSNNLLKNQRKFFCITCADFCNRMLSGSKKLKEDIRILLAEFEDKEHILQTLDDYKNASRNFKLNLIMLSISAFTLALIIFPDRAIWIANVLRTGIYYIRIILQCLLTKLGILK